MTLFKTLRVSSWVIGLIDRDDEATVPFQNFGSQWEALSASNGILMNMPNPTQLKHLKTSLDKHVVQFQMPGGSSRVFLAINLLDGDKSIHMPSTVRQISTEVWLLEEVRISENIVSSLGTETK